MKNMLSNTLVTIFATLVLAACGTETKTETVVEEVIVNTETIVEVEKNPYILTVNLTSFGLDVQDDYEVVINDGEIPDNVYLSNINVYLRKLNDNNQWGQEVRYDITLDRNTFSIDLYEKGKYSLRISANHYANDGINHVSSSLSQYLITSIEDDLDINVDLLPSIYSGELVTHQLTGERTATMYDYLSNGDQICYKKYNQYRWNLFYTENENRYASFSLLCKTEGTLSEINLGMTDDSTFQLHSDNNVYSGSDIIFVNRTLNPGTNYIDFSVENKETANELVLKISSLTIDTASQQQIITNVVDDTRYIVEKAEFFVPDTNELVVMSLYGDLIMDDVCTNQDSFKINGELVQSSYFSSEHNAYCYKPTGLEGQNVFLDIFPRTEVNTWRGWIFESDEPGLQLIYAKGHSWLTNSDGENQVSEWFAK